MPLGDGRRGATAAIGFQRNEIDAAVRNGPSVQRDLPFQARRCGARPATTGMKNQNRDNEPD